MTSQTLHLEVTKTSQSHSYTVAYDPLVNAHVHETLTGFIHVLQTDSLDRLRICPNRALTRARAEFSFRDVAWQAVIRKGERLVLTWTTLRAGRRRNGPPFEGREIKIKVVHTPPLAQPLRKIGGCLR